MESFFNPKNDIDQEKKLVDLHMFDIFSVCRKVHKILKVVYIMLSCIVESDHTCQNVFQGLAYIEEITKLCRENKVC